jgi:hypothetical protein
MAGAAMCRSIDKIFTTGDGSGIGSRPQGRSGPIIFFIPGNLDKNVKTQYQYHPKGNKNEEDLLNYIGSF